MLCTYFWTIKRAMNAPGGWEGRYMAPRNIIVYLLIDFSQETENCIFFWKDWAKIDTSGWLLKENAWKGEIPLSKKSYKLLYEVTVHLVTKCLLVVLLDVIVHYSVCAVCFKVGHDKIKSVPQLFKLCYLHQTKWGCLHLWVKWARMCFSAWNLTLHH